MNKKKGKYITLKEAGKVADYSPDYIGQLIRQGKIPGKQIYTAVSWVTTEDAVLEYVNEVKNKKRTNQTSTGFLTKAKQIKRRALLDVKLSQIARSLLYGAIGALVMFAMFLFYVFSVNIDEKLESWTIQNNQNINNLNEIKASGAKINGF